jgi:hypothetical protein
MAAAVDDADCGFAVLLGDCLPAPSCCCCCCWLPPLLRLSLQGKKHKEGMRDKPGHCMLLPSTRHVIAAYSARALLDHARHQAGLWLLLLLQHTVYNTVQLLLIEHA